MRSNRLVRGCLLSFLLIFGGCVAPRAYVDPSFGKTTYNDIVKRTEPFRWRIVAEFQRNGVHFPQADSELLGHVERVIRASGLAVPSADQGASEFKVVVNNVADLSAAAVKGVGTGLTLGLVGSNVTDAYEMEVILTTNGHVITKSGYKHALHSTIGNASRPVGMTPTTPAAAFGIVVEQMLLNALKDLEQSNGLSFIMPESSRFQTVHWSPYRSTKTSVD